MTTYTGLNLFGMTISSTLGSLFGAIIHYYIGKIFHKDRLKAMISGKVGKILMLKEADIDRANDWFELKGQKTVFFCRFVPLIRSLISIPAGMSQVKMIRFLTYTTIGSLIWNIVVISLGMLVGSNWESILTIFDTYSHITVFVLGIASILFIYVFYKRKLRFKNN